MLRSEKSAEELYKTHVEVLNVIKNKDIQNAEHIIRQSYFYDEGALDG
jgi:tetrahydromethanopterin S-methyltransferase subunit A